MAPSSKLAALFYAFAVVAATLVPAAEARVQGFNHEAAASEPAIAGEKTAASGGAQQPPTTLPGLLPVLPFPLFPLPQLPVPGSPAGGVPPSAGSGGFPFPLPFPLPLPAPGSSAAGAPPSSGSPGSSPSQPSPAQPQPKECMTPLLSVMPCADYLTNTDVQKPPATCCDGFKSLVNTAPICLCHGLNGDLNSFLPKPVDPMKMMLLPITCGAMPPLQTLLMCSSPSVPPLMAPSSPAAPAPASPPVCRLACLLLHSHALVLMSPSSKLAALFFALAVVAATLVLAAEARVQGFNHEAAASERAIAGEKTAASGGAQQPPTTLPGLLPGLPFPLFPFLMFPFPQLPIPGSPAGAGGAPPSARSGGFPFPMPFQLPLPAHGSPASGAPPSSGSGFPFPLPFPLPLPAPGSPAGGAPPSSGSGFPFPLPFPFLLPAHGSPAGGAPPSSGSPGVPPSSSLPFPFPFPLPQPSSPGSSPSPAQPQPKECMTPLMSVMPCADYLTNTAVQTPPATCCDGFKSLVSSAPICLCHGMNGDLNSFLPKPVDPMKMMLLPITCGAMPPLQTLFMCSSPSVPPLMPPSSTAAPAPASPPACHLGLMVYLMLHHSHGRLS
uniref:Bifunctional inhibitor/plant lipid transfer protein/seed storage helical domain-containing protein n=1 Tax=Oryza punctata TaxID=4537 RepID=A0A0E0K4N5_ORYPU